MGQNGHGAVLSAVFLGEALGQRVLWGSLGPCRIVIESTDFLERRIEGNVSKEAGPVGASVVPCAFHLLSFPEAPKPWSPGEVVLICTQNLSIWPRLPPGKKALSLLAGGPNRITILNACFM
jgi:hypothetical protein